MLCFEGKLHTVNSSSLQSFAMKNKNEKTAEMVMTTSHVETGV